MRYALLALAVTGFIAFSAAPVLAECAGHTKTAEKPSSTTIADKDKASKPLGG